MPFTASLEIESKTFDLVEFSCQLIQKYDASGKPVSGVRGGILDLIVAGTDDDTFCSWMSSPTATKDGTITFFGSSEGSKIKQIKYKSAYIVTLMESFIVDEYLPFIEMERVVNMTMDGAVQLYSYQDLMSCQTRNSYTYLFYCSISAEIINIDGEEHNNKW